MENIPHIGPWIKKVQNLSSVIGEGAFELGVSLVAIIMVERFWVKPVWVGLQSVMIYGINLFVSLLLIPIFQVCS